MKHFILDANPNFSESTVTVSGIKFKLKNVKGNGAYFIEYKDDVPADEIALTKQAMKALYLLLTTK